MKIEEFQQALANIVSQFQTADYDTRHLLLDLSEKILALADQAPHLLPDHFKSEWKSICREVDEVQPTFKSHRKTSILLDREGMGQPGRQRANAIITRIVALSKSVNRLENEENSPD
ncbi:MAG: hypothetical protein K0U86_17900 [Planctomycetes bacterium]|nr:hypothetical protein [Planctomycetota bacterium]MCH9726781.1 hypothetical protein [Planctomycetota bacterium]MCH9776806.1 hypothetical protein [Planctomycetota bacterium]